MQDVQEFIAFLLRYTSDKLLSFGKRFEKIKNIIVALLIVKRGKYSSSFLNTSFFLLVVTAVVAGPTIAENNPLIQSFELNNPNNAEAAIVAYDPYQSSLSTIISDKPRDKVENYVVREGDTMAAIAKRFAIDVDSIKWANNTRSDSIKPGQTLKIPPGTGVVHKVSSGDNIYTIAKKYQVDAQAIVNWPFNDFSDLENFTLTPGQVIFVPNGVVEDAPAKPAQRYVAQIQAGARGTSSFIWPTSGSITQYPIYYHMALDIANPTMPPVIAADTGTVTFSGCINWGYGCHVIIDHGNGYQSLYGHMSRLDVNVGDSVGQGQQIGVMGSTGRSTGTHLHFEIRTGGTLLNPLDFLK
jgi:murein DD-endopeptidase MepM/ murein hydrolase activator NlpD